MRVSVIMGVYNCKNADMLRMAVKSIINQTYTDWEFIICDDGSTNDTLRTLQEIQGLDDRIRVISYPQNHGLAYALNQCIEVAQGDLIARQDDDDYSEPDRLRRQVEFMDQHPEYAIVGSTAAVFDDGGAWGRYSVSEEPTKEDFLWGSPFIHPAVVMRKKALNNIGNYRISRETNRRAQDYDMFMRMYASGNRGYNIQEDLYNYRIVLGKKKHLSMMDRIRETTIRRKGFEALGLYPKAIPYVAKPLIVGLIPQRIFKVIRRYTYKNEGKFQHDLF